MDRGVEGYRAVMQELIRGHESATRLKAILSGQPPPSQEAGGAGGAAPDPDKLAVEALMEQISGSFARSISFLMSFSDVEQPGGCPSFNGAAHHYQQQEDHPRVLKKTADPLTSWNNAAAGSRRREYPGAQKFILSALPEDGHCWKKYGQKNILGAKHPRSYFKCSQKKDQGCQAIKQVQMTEDDPPKYLVTYVGQHTCSAAVLYADDELMDQLMTAGNAYSNQCFLSFESADQHGPNLQKQAAATLLDDRVLFSVHDPDHNSGKSAMAMSDGARYSCGAVPAVEGRGVFSPADAASMQTRDHENMEPAAIAVHFLESEIAGFCSTDGGSGGEG